MSFLRYHQQYKNKIFNYFLYRVNFDRQIAEDLTSETFLKAYEHFDDFDQNRPFQPWIYRIAHNLLANHYRDTRPNLSLETMAEEDFQPVVTKAFRNLTNEGEMALLVEAIHHLPKTQREIIRYRHVDQLDYAEIAELTGQSEGALRVTYHRAIENLKNKFN